MALGSAVASRVDQAGVAGGLAEPQQGLEDLDLRPVQLGRCPCARGHRGSGPAARRSSWRCVGLHVAVERLLGLLGQILDDLGLGAAEDERLRGPWPARRGRRRRGRRRCRLAYFLKTVSLPSMPGFKNSKIDQSSPRWFSIGVPLMASRCRPRSSRAALADWLSAFLIAWASSRIT